MTFRTLPGLPPYGPLATSFPHRLPVTGTEGYVVEFLPDSADSWVGNFAPGLGGYTGVLMHPNKTDVLVFSKGSGYVIDVQKRDLKANLPGEIESVWEVDNPTGVVCDRQGLAFFRVGPLGLSWHTRRISLDGFRGVVLAQNCLTGFAYDLGDSWQPFEVDLARGSTHGTKLPEVLDQGWEKLAG